MAFFYGWKLKISKELLSENGAIFINIDDNEHAQLKLLCDDVFGEENFLTSIPWHNRNSIQNNTDISVNHDAVGVVTGEVELDTAEEYYQRKREVQWISKGKSINIIELNHGYNLEEKTIYQTEISVGDLLSKIPYVFIIDEINKR